MRKVILSFVCMLGILSACEKIILNDPSKPVIAINPSDTSIVNTPVVTAPVVITPAVTTPVVTTPVITTPAVTAMSFSKDVVPVLAMCENCHIHGWTRSSVASTYYTNLINRGYVVPASYTTSKIYGGIINGHFGNGISTTNSNKILDWMKAGSINN